MSSDSQKGKGESQTKLSRIARPVQLPPFPFPPSPSRHGFTLPELLAVLCIVVLLFATFVPYALSLRETDRRARCAANLGKIWWALSQYAETNGGSYPRTRFDDRLGNRWAAFTGADDANPFSAMSAVQPNDVTASIWLLIRTPTVDAKPEWFVCPSSEGTAEKLTSDAKSRGNFRSPENLTYAIASPFSAVSDYALRDTLPSNFVLVADQGPTVSQLSAGRVPAADAPPRALASANSVNHRRAGQNVLYAFGQVVFESTPYVGVGRRPSEPAKDGAAAKPAVPGDNIYTALAAAPLVDAKPDHASPGVAGVTVGPSYRYDTYLVPGADFAAEAEPREPMTRPTTAAIAAPARPTTSAATSAPAVARPASTAPAATLPAATAPSLPAPPTSAPAATQTP